jgi:uncharacterized protein (DUF1501 family)
MKRRHFLKHTSAATLAALAGNAPRLLAAKQATQLRPKADCMILLWMAGGMAHTETFDPKRHTDFTKGVEAKAVLSTFPSIKTKVDGIELTEGLERIASVMDRGTLIRSHVLGDLGQILHSRHQYHWHTGYEPPQTVAAPPIGAWLSHTLGPRNEAMPAFIEIGQSYDGNGESEELKAFTSGGFLGSEFGPFRISDPREAMKSVQPPAGMTLARFQNRDRAFRKLMEATPLADLGSDAMKDSYLRSLDNAYRLLSSPAAKAFDLDQETKESRALYGDTKFGQGCLLARRLVESGARYIEVTSEYYPFKGWDTHDNGHTRLADMKKMIDSPIAQLVLDLEARGLLDRTLIVLASEFSRDMLTEGKPDAPVKGGVQQPDIIEDLKFYGMHRHFTAASSVLAFGGGFKRGHLYGKTADERPCVAVEKPITITDLHATIYESMGIGADHGVRVEQRPFYVTTDGKGQPQRDLLA